METTKEIPTMKSFDEPLGGEQIPRRHPYLRLTDQSTGTAELMLCYLETELPSVAYNDDQGAPVRQETRQDGTPKFHDVATCIFLSGTGCGIPAFDAEGNPLYGPINNEGKRDRERLPPPVGSIVTVDIKSYTRKYWHEGAGEARQQGIELWPGTFFTWAADGWAEGEGKFNHKASRFIFKARADGDWLDRARQVFEETQALADPRLEKIREDLAEGRRQMYQQAPAVPPPAQQQGGWHYPPAQQAGPPPHSEPPPPQHDYSEEPF